MARKSGELLLIIFRGSSSAIVIVRVISVSREIARLLVITYHRRRGARLVRMSKLASIISSISL